MVADRGHVRQVGVDKVPLDQALAALTIGHFSTSSGGS